MAENQNQAEQLEVLEVAALLVGLKKRSLNLYRNIKAMITALVRGE